MAATPLSFESLWIGCKPAIKKETNTTQFRQVYTEYRLVYKRKSSQLQKILNLQTKQKVANISSNKNARLPSVLASSVAAKEKI